MELAIGGVLVTIFLAGFGCLATEIRGLRESMNKGFTGLRTELKGEIRELTDRYISHLEWHQRSG
jgi:hypothetical protein